MTDSYESRVKEALSVLADQSRHTFRYAGTGPLIEHLGCILAGLKGSWWPDRNGGEPELNPPPEQKEEFTGGYYVSNEITGQWVYVAPDRVMVPIDDIFQATSWSTAEEAQAYADTLGWVEWIVFKVSIKPLSREDIVNAT